MTFEQHYTNLITDLESKFPKLVKKYDLSVSHSGGGCFHIEMRLDKKRSVLINPYSDDVEYDIPKNEKSKCIFGIYNEDYEEHETFFTPFENGLKQVQKMKGNKK
tara:strand:+ start:130 stop:444 length:315 start_codon:yes stop_codon:yes gene_type:complete